MNPLVDIDVVLYNHVGMDYEWFINILVLIKYNCGAINHYGDKKRSHGGKNGYNCDGLRYSHLWWLYL